MDSLAKLIQNKEKEFDLVQQNLQISRDEKYQKMRDIFTNLAENLKKCRDSPGLIAKEIRTYGYPFTHLLFEAIENKLELALDFVLDHYALQIINLKVEFLDDELKDTKAELKEIKADVRNLQKESAARKFNHYLNTITLELQKQMALDVTGSSIKTVADLLGSESTMNPTEKTKFSEYKTLLGDLNKFKDLLVTVKECRDGDTHLGQPGSTFPPLQYSEIVELMDQVEVGSVTRAAVEASRQKCPEVWTKPGTRRKSVVYI